jgi:hypothetical protein
VRLTGRRLTEERPTRIAIEWKAGHQTGLGHLAGKLLTEREICDP